MIFNPFKFLVFNFSKEDAQLISKIDVYSLISNSISEYCTFKFGYIFKAHWKNMNSNKNKLVFKVLKKFTVRIYKSSFKSI